MALPSLPRTVRGMPLRTGLATYAIDALARKPVGDCSLEEIQAARARVYPRSGPLARMFGRVRKDVSQSTRHATARDGHQIRLRTYYPHDMGGLAGALPIVVFFHGGGWVWGNIVNYDPLCSWLSAEVQALVVSVDYRLAPEFPAPTAAHDAIDATEWIADNALHIGGDGSVMAVCGDSAGGNLAAVVAQTFRDAGRSNLLQQSLIYPATDMTMSSPSIAEHANGAILTKKMMDGFADHYVPDHGGRTDPIVSPLFGRLDGLPPALIQTADLDPIRDDGSRYAAALEAAGVPVVLTNYPGVPHGFASVPGVTLVADQHRGELVRELRRYLRP